MKLTPWFCGKVRPVRVGYYQRDYYKWNPLCYWNGQVWGCADEFGAKRELPSMSQRLRWRGLSTKPKGAK